MVFDAVAAVETGQPRVIDDSLEVSIIAVAQNYGKITAGPVRCASRVCPADAFKRGEIPGYRQVFLLLVRFRTPRSSIGTAIDETLCPKHCRSKITRAAHQVEPFGQEAAWPTQGTQAA